MAEMRVRTVLRIIDRLNVGGPALHAAVTARGLDPSRYRTVLVVGSVEPGEADMGDLLDGAACEIVRIPSLGRELRPARDIATARALYDVVRRVRPDVVHTHKAKAGALGRTAALLARVPVRVHTFHGHVFRGYFSPRKTQAFLGIERALARISTKLVALSDRLVDELADEYRIAPRDKFAVVPLGLPLERYSRLPRRPGALHAALGLPRSRRLVGIVGRMVPVKDHATFLRAAALVAARDTDVDFVVIGGGELEADVRAQVSSLALSSRVHLLGWRRDLEALYPDLDVVALSSVNEGTPVTLIEAMSAGVPVASTEVGGVADVLAGGARGELARAGDPASLADAILRALSSDAERRAAMQRSAIAEQFGAARLCRDLEALYDRLLAAR
jgi:glycosyltransferase involved in cell wall biosynthesis